MLQKPNCPVIALEEHYADPEMVATFTGAGLPLGWGTVAACAIATGCNWGQGKGLFDPAPDAGIGSDVWFFLGTLAGWTLMVLTLLPGARFWFDALSRLGSLRSSGPKPERAPG